MVKEAEKRRKVNPLLPIFGLILAIGLAVVALVLSNALIQGDIGRIQQLAQYRTGPNATPALLGIAFVIWLPLLALIYLLVAILAGRDPNAGKDIGLPPRNVKRIRRR